MRVSAWSVNHNVDLANFIRSIFVDLVNEVHNAWLAVDESRNGVYLSKQATEFTVVFPHIGNVFVQISSVEVVTWTEVGIGQQLILRENLVAFHLDIAKLESRAFIHRVDECRSFSALQPKVWQRQMFILGILVRISHQLKLWQVVRIVSPDAAFNFDIEVSEIVVVLLQCGHVTRQRCFVVLATEQRSKW